MNDLITLFNALSDPSRLRIVNLLLSSRELCVCDIEATLKFTQTKVSRHMRYLKECGLVRSRKSGRWVFYSIPPAAPKWRGTMLSELKSILAAMNLPAADRSRLPNRMRNDCHAGDRHAVGRLSRKGKSSQV